MKKITIAIDGWSSCGKSTLAKALAKKLGYIYVDSGAMYRGISLFALHQKWVSENHLDKEEVINALKKIELDFQYDEKTEKAKLVLNGKNVEEEIRTLTVSNVVSKIATIKEVRQHLVSQQQQMGKNGGVVMDGRDIGSVVFPNAELKLFVTADVDIRAQRRYQEMLAKGQQPSLEEVKKNLQQRDEMDTNRTESPLIKTDDAIVLDNTQLNQEEQLQLALEYVKNIQKV